MSVDRDRRCILVELVDGSTHGYQYPDHDSAEKWCEGCREDWNAGGTLLFYLVHRSWRDPTEAMHAADEVSHLELTTREDAQARGAVCRDAFIYG